jgi:hypothetical protein
MNIFTSSMSWHLAIAISLLFSLLLSFLVSFFFESNIQQVFSAPKKSGLRIIPKVSSVDFRASARLARIWDPVGQTFKASARSEVEISLAVPFFFFPSKEQRLQSTRADSMGSELRGHGNTKNATRSSLRADQDGSEEGWIQ